MSYIRSFHHFSSCPLDVLLVKFFLWECYMCTFTQCGLICLHMLNSGIHVQSLLGLMSKGGHLPHSCATLSATVYRSPRQGFSTVARLISQGFSNHSQRHLDSLQAGTPVISKWLVMEYLWTLLPPEAAIFWVDTVLDLWTLECL